MPRPFFLFAPGAGAPSSHPWMRHWQDLLGEIGYVTTFDYDYQRAGRPRPDRLLALMAAHRDALARLRAEVPPGAALFLIGKSMGGRIGCHLALEEKVNGVICLGYPLCALGDRAKLRDQVLLSLATPILFVQGTRDKLCPLDLLAPVRAGMTAPNDLHLVEGGDHSLGVGRRALQLAGEMQEDVDRRILEAIADFISGWS